MSERIRWLGFSPPWRLLACSALLAFPLLLWGAPRGDSGTREAITKLLAEEGLQGAVWSTVAGENVSDDAAGFCNAATAAPMLPENRVHVGSIAKTVLATGVLHLVTQSRLSLDTPLSAVLPDLDLDNPWEEGHPIRIRHLLDHTAGLDDARFADVFSLRARPDAPLSAFLEGRTLKVRSRPGSRHSYSNTGYTLLGMVIEAVTGTRYEAYLEKHLLWPLGMRDSTFFYTTQNGGQVDAHLAMGHFENGTTVAAVPMYLRPAGQFTTTAADMARFARFLLSDGRINGHALVDEALLGAMGHPTDTEAAHAGLEVGYGLGLATRDRHGVVGKCHGGSTVGFRAMLCLFPDTGQSFFLAINTDHESADYGAFDRLLIRSLGLVAKVPHPSVASESDAAEGFYVPAPNRFASLELIDIVLNFARVGTRVPGLRFDPFQATDIDLVPLGNGLYRAADRTVASHAALVTADGRHVISTGLQTFERRSLLTLAPLWMSFVFGLLGIAWILVMGFGNLVRGWRAWLKAPVAIPFLGVVGLLLPVPLFLRQSFLELGDLTPASGLLAATTMLLPVSMAAGLILSLRHRPLSRTRVLNAVAMIAVLQWTLVLAWWGLIPLRTWS